MKTLILYYSYTGNCRKKAAQLKSKLDADMEEIKTLKKPGKLAAYTIGCFKSIRQRGVAIKPIKVDLRAYDKIILIAPVWASGPAPAFNSAVTLIPVGKTVEVYLVSMSGKSNKERNIAFVTSKGLKLDGYHDVKS